MLMNCEMHIVPAGIVTIWLMPRKSVPEKAVPLPVETSVAKEMIHFISNGKILLFPFRLEN